MQVTRAGVRLAPALVACKFIEILPLTRLLTLVSDTRFFGINLLSVSPFPANSLVKYLKLNERECKLKIAIESVIVVRKF
jgi:hypothetical protein